MPEPILQVRDLAKHYPVERGIIFKHAVGHVHALDGVDLDLDPGETLGIVGESGCGKSTLARLLVAIERPTRGSVRYQGKDLATMSETELKQARREIQIVFQDPYASLDPRMTVANLIAEPMEIHPEAVPRRDRAARVVEMLERVGLSAADARRYPHQFSGGQRQRIGIARALALRPRVLLLDEPVSALDVSIQAQVLNLLLALREELHLSCVFISHDLSVVRHVADRVSVMYLGRVVETGPEEEIYERATHPYTQTLLAAVPAPNPRLRGALSPIPIIGEIPSPLQVPAGCRFRTRCWRARANCASEEPTLIPRPDSRHPSACFYAAPFDPATVSSTNSQGDAAR